MIGCGPPGASWCSSPCTAPSPWWSRVEVTATGARADGRAVVLKVTVPVGLEGTGSWLAVAEAVTVAV